MYMATCTCFIIAILYNITCDLLYVYEFCKKEKSETPQKIVFSKCRLRLGVLCVLCCSVCWFFVMAILSWCHETWHVYIVYNILSFVSLQFILYDKFVYFCKRKYKQAYQDKFYVVIIVNSSQKILKQYI